MPSLLTIATLAGSLLAVIPPVAATPVGMAGPAMMPRDGQRLEDALSGASPVNGDCGAAASQVVAETGGDLLSVQMTSDGQCVVTVLIPGNGGRPKKVTVRVPM